MISIMSAFTYIFVLYTTPNRFARNIMIVDYVLLMKNKRILKVTFCLELAGTVYSFQWPISDFYKFGQHGAATVVSGHIYPFYQSLAAFIDTNNVMRRC